MPIPSDDAELAFFDHVPALAEWLSTHHERAGTPIAPAELSDPITRAVSTV